MSLKDVPILADMARTRRATPKPVGGRLQAATAKIRDEAKQAAAFRAAVWKRAGSKCESCGRRVVRTLAFTPDAGHVDHIKPRSTSPAQKYDPQNGRLLCGSCHLERHGQRMSR